MEHPSSLAIALEQFTNLCTLSLGFKDCIKVRDQALQNLFLQAFARLELLSNLKMNLEGCREVTKEGLLSLASSVLPQMKLWKAFTMNIDGCWRLDKNAVERFFETLKTYCVVGNSVPWTN